MLSTWQVIQLPTPFIQTRFGTFEGVDDIHRDTVARKMSQNVRRAHLNPMVESIMLRRK